MTNSDLHDGVVQPRRPKLHWITIGLVISHVIVAGFCLVAVRSWPGPIRPLATGIMAGVLVAPFVLYLAVTGLIWLVSGRPWFMPNTLLLTSVVLAWLALDRPIGSAQAGSQLDPAAAAGLAQQRDALIIDACRELAEKGKCRVNERVLGQCLQAARRAKADEVGIAREYRTVISLLNELCKKKAGYEAKLEEQEATGGPPDFSPRGLKRCLGWAEKMRAHARDEKACLDQIEQHMMVLRSPEVSPPSGKLSASQWPSEWPCSILRQAVLLHVKETDATCTTLKLVIDNWGRCQRDQRAKRFIAPGDPDLDRRLKELDAVSKECAQQNFDLLLKSAHMDTEEGVKKILSNPAR